MAPDESRSTGGDEAVSGSHSQSGVRKRNGHPERCPFAGTPGGSGAAGRRAKPGHDFEQVVDGGICFHSIREACESDALKKMFKYC